MVYSILSIYFAIQSAFMSNANSRQQEELHQIKQMMERSSRFISLSGLSGIAAGTCALVGAYFASNVINKNYNGIIQSIDGRLTNHSLTLTDLLRNSLMQIAIFTFLSALITSFIFTFLRSKHTNVSVWGTTSQRLFVNISIPLIVGGVFLLKLILIGAVGLVAPACLIFYGLALINASKYTLIEIKYLGYSQLIVGIINLLIIEKGILLWAVGFGGLHIIYGLIMWMKYERQ